MTKEILGDSAFKVLEGVQADMPIKDICDYVGITRSTIAVHLNNLIDRGYIRRRELRCPYEVTADGEKIFD